ncbi:hypothetical protein GBAR_LOCUS30903 [Geodia barretti]|uniref:Uncharacterized protein n=1 Tax=Geodia barretti TaxID=519541 RepID=A0AA35TYA2_GEOBA|nr:hypothetical protein GBAR_LOCUS30903 [Geodia barretti]
MVSVGTQTPWSWLHSFTEDEKKKGENAILDRPLLGVSRSSGMPEIGACSREAREEQKEGLEKLSLPHIVTEEAMSAPESQHLAALQFPSDSYSASSTSSGEEEVGDTILPSLAVEPSAPNTELAVRQLSWPAVLRYLRESESEASKYFSIDREPRKVLKGVERDQETARENTSNELMPNEARCATEEAVVAELNKLCHFCGQPLGEWSVLQSATGSGDQGRAEACCWQFKEFCLLVAGCLRQMIAERVSAQPTEITVKLRNKKDVKMEAEERALALLRRRKRQRKKMAKKTLQSSSFYSLTKQTKTIQFSLLSPAVLSTGWTFGERQRTSIREQKKKKKRNVTRKLPPEILELLIKSMAGPREVDVRQYPDSSISFSTLLPDHTGHYRYPSGSLAVLIYSHTPGVLSYLLFSVIVRFS